MLKDRDLQYYRSLPYTRLIEQRTESNGKVIFLASIKEIPFIQIHGASREEALFLLSETFEDCVEALLESGEEIPEPDLWPGQVDRSQQIPLIRTPAASSFTNPEVSVSALQAVVEPWTMPSRAETVAA